jgi:hypothetical protein
MVVVAIALLGIAFAAWVTIATPNIPIETVVNNQVPGWVLGTENLLNKFSRVFDLFYIIGDVILLIIATTLLLAFWGGKFSQSWKMLAAATIALYIADMWFKYAATLPQEYESGGLLEVFFVFSAVLFGIGAALEYDVSSSRPARGRRRK